MIVRKFSVECIFIEKNLIQTWVGYLNTLESYCKEAHRTVYGFGFEILSFSGIPIIYELHYNILKIHRINHLILYFVYSET